MRDSFRDRVDPGSFEDDIRYRVLLTPDPRDEVAQVVETYVSERLMDRLRWLGMAYELRLLARVPTDGRWSYPEVQCSPLEDEVLFLLQIVDDPALATAAEPLLDFARRATRERRGTTLVIEAP